MHEDFEDALARVPGEGLYADYIPGHDIPSDEEIDDAIASLEELALW